MSVADNMLEVLRLELEAIDEALGPPCEPVPSLDGGRCIDRIEAIKRLRAKVDELELRPGADRLRAIESYRGEERARIAELEAEHARRTAVLKAEHAAAAERMGALEKLVGSRARKIERLHSALSALIDAAERRRAADLGGASLLGPDLAAARAALAGEGPS